jgi:hypothetical protein
MKRESRFSFLTAFYLCVVAVVVIIISDCYFPFYVLDYTFIFSLLSFVDNFYQI